MAKIREHLKLLKRHTGRLETINSYSLVSWNLVKKFFLYGLFLIFFTDKVEIESNHARDFLLNNCRQLLDIFFQNLQLFICLHLFLTEHFSLFLCLLYRVLHCSPRQLKLLVPSHQNLSLFLQKPLWFLQLIFFQSRIFVVDVCHLVCFKIFWLQYHSVDQFVLTFDNLLVISKEVLHIVYALHFLVLDFLVHQIVYFYCFLEFL